MKVVIVANGPMEPCPNKIDKCDVVIRMHHEDISKMEHVVGSKMDIWVTPVGMIQPWMNPPWIKINDCKEIWSFNPPGQIYPVKNVFHLSEYFTRFAHSMIPGKKSPSKGFMTILYSLIRFQTPIYITGFSFYENKKGWFWDPSDRKQPLTGLDIGTEMQIMTKMIGDRVIQWI